MIVINLRRVRQPKDESWHFLQNLPDLFIEGVATDDLMLSAFNR
jgi:hypothetical protein